MIKYSYYDNWNSLQKDQIVAMHELCHHQMHIGKLPYIIDINPVQHIN